MNTSAFRNEAGLLDAVSAYDRISPIYSEMARRRSAYLAAIEDLIALQIPPGSRSLLDVGAGDGSRARRIADRAHIGRVVLLEPSCGMARHVSPSCEVWNIRAQ